jgi:hypothetical protein
MEEKKNRSEKIGSGKVASSNKFVGAGTEERRLLNAGLFMMMISD